MQNERIRRWINQFTCKHEWRSLGNMRMYVTHEYGCTTHHICDDVECVRCGKIITEFINSPRYLNEQKNKSHDNEKQNTFCSH